MIEDQQEKNLLTQERKDQIIQRLQQSRKKQQELDQSQQQQSQMSDKQMKSIEKNLQYDNYLQESFKKSQKFGDFQFDDNYDALKGMDTDNIENQQQQTLQKPPLQQQQQQQIQHQKMGNQLTIAQPQVNQALQGMKEQIYSQLENNRMMKNNILQQGSQSKNEAMKQYKIMQETDNNNMPLQQQFLSQRKGQKKNQEGEKYSVKKLMFGDLPVQSNRQIINQQKQEQLQQFQQQQRGVRSRSIDQKYEDNPYIRYQKGQSANSLSPKKERFNRQLDFEFINSNEEEAEVIQELITQHGSKVIRNDKVTDYQRRTEEEYINKQKFPFKPKITELPRNIYNEEKPKLEISKEEQWDRLLKGKKEVHDEREIQKIQQDAQYLKDRCSFKPQVNLISQLLTKRDKYQNQNYQGDAGQRLYEQGMEKKKDFELMALRQKEEEKFMMEHPFRPDVSSSVSKLMGNAQFQKPLFQRVEDVVQEKQQQQVLLQLEHAEENKCSFKPQINENSEKINEYRLERESKDVIERLMEHAVRKMKEREVRYEEGQQQISQECTFYPSTISQKNEEILQDNVFFNKELSFVKRQEVMQDYIREKLGYQAEKIRNENKYRPEINRISKFLVETDENRANETQLDKINRLSKKDQEKKEILQEQISKAYYEQYDHKPKLNSISKAMVEKRTIEELTNVSQKNEKLQQKKKEKEIKEMQQCSFKPKTNNFKKKFQGVQSKYGAKENISMNLKDTQEQKEQKKEQIKQNIEYEQMRQCTFKPELNKQCVIKQDVEIKGMDKYMQYRELHKKQKIDQKSRENELFHLERKYDQENHPKKTYVKEFKLSKGNSKQTDQLKQQLEEEEKKVCTFKPRTNEGKNKAIIKKILEKSSQDNNNNVQQQQQQQQQNQQQYMEQEYYNVSDLEQEYQNEIQQQYMLQQYGINQNNNNIQQQFSVNKIDTDHRQKLEQIDDLQRHLDEQLQYNSNQQQQQQQQQEQEINLSNMQYQIFKPQQQQQQQQQYQFQQQQQEMSELPITNVPQPVNKNNNNNLQYLQ